MGSIGHKGSIKECLCFPAFLWRFWWQYKTPWMAHYITYSKCSVGRTVYNFLYLFPVRVYSGQIWTLTVCWTVVIIAGLFDVRNMSGFPSYGSDSTPSLTAKQSLCCEKKVERDQFFPVQAVFNCFRWTVMLNQPHMRLLMANKILLLCVAVLESFTLTLEWIVHSYMYQSRTATCVYLFYVLSWIL